MCAFWLNTYRCEKYEHFWPSSLLKFYEFIFTKTLTTRSVPRKMYCCYWITWWVANPAGPCRKVIDVFQNHAYYGTFPGFAICMGLLLMPSNCWAGRRAIAQWPLQASKRRWPVTTSRRKVTAQKGSSGSATRRDVGKHLKPGWSGPRYVHCKICRV